MTLFKLKKQGDPEKNEQNSVLWGHSRDKYGGSMKTYDWDIKIVSTHKSALNRQITEAIRISRVKKEELLNSKNEFGANNVPEIQLKYGTKVGPGGTKRKRAAEEEPDIEPDVEPDQPETEPDEPPPNSQGREGGSESTHPEDFSVRVGDQQIVGNGNPTQLGQELPRKVQQREVLTSP